MVTHAAIPLGFLAAACDLIQNLGVAAILLDSNGQPAPRIAEFGGFLTWVFGLVAGAVFVIGMAVSLWRDSRTV